MTAVVGILNKQAVALAADSAVTFSGINNRKILNRANKVFTLSKYHPVGVMIYNSASFMTTPWETIIKMYRKQLGKRSFESVQKYKEDFITYLHQQNLFSDEATQKKYLQYLFQSVIEILVRDVLSNNRHLLINPTDLTRGKVISLMEQKIDALIPQVQVEICEEFKDYNLDEFLQFCESLINDVHQNIFTKNDLPVSAPFTNKLKSFLYHFTRCKEETTQFTGLVFAGFGDLEIFPSLLPLNISLAIQNRLRYFVDSSREVHINNNVAGAVRPFAQTDVIDTILSGIDPTLDSTYLENFKLFFTKYNQEIVNILSASNSELSAQIKGLNIDKLMQEYSKKNQETKRSNYIQPLMNAVSTLAKEDLAEMAESLIYLTYLKRRITFAEESVGGPVDVAVISKGDGFIWMKRKHYFKPELNRQFFNNYFND